jgi:hypothetical protein
LTRYHFLDERIIANALIENLGRASTSDLACFRQLKRFSSTQVGLSHLWVKESHYMCQ